MSVASIMETTRKQIGVVYPQDQEWGSEARVAAAEKTNKADLNNKDNNKCSE